VGQQGWPGCHARHAASWQRAPLAVRRSPGERERGWARWEHRDAREEEKGKGLGRDISPRGRAREQAGVSASRSRFGAPQDLPAPQTGFPARPPKTPSQRKAKSSAARCVTGEEKASSRAAWLAANVRHQSGAEDTGRRARLRRGGDGDEVSSSEGSLAAASRGGPDPEDPEGRVRERSGVIFFLVQMTAPRSQTPGAEPRAPLVRAEARRG